MVTFSSREAFRQALHAIRQPVTRRLTKVPVKMLNSFQANGIFIKVGGDLLGEVIPGASCSLVARLAGVPLPGLRLRFIPLIRCLFQRG